MILIKKSNYYLLNKAFQKIHRKKIIILPKSFYYIFNKLKQKKIRKNKIKKLKDDNNYIYSNSLFIFEIKRETNKPIFLNSCLSGNYRKIISITKDKKIIHNRRKTDIQEEKNINRIILILIGIIFYGMFLSVLVALYFILKGWY